jgi:hypothetical protein
MQTTTQQAGRTRNVARNLTVPTTQAGHVKGGWFWYFPPQTTKTTTINSDVKGESTVKDHANE